MCLMCKKNGIKNEHRVLESEGIYKYKKNYLNTEHNDNNTNTEVNRN